jgi:hypothetical protein
VSVVYHAVPRDMVGDVLYPLNRLSEVDPRLYEFQRAKYGGRESVLEYPVPGTDLRWADTVQCAALHPYHLFKARRELGLPAPRKPAPPSWLTGLVYEIPVERLAPSPVVWYSGRTLWINGAPDEDVPLLPPADEFEPFDPARYEPLDAPTPAHLDYLKRMEDRGKPPLMFVHIPHVLVAGPVDVAGVRVVPWDEPPSRQSG